MQVAAAAGHSTAVATIATVTAAVQATWGSEKDKLGNPTEWYVADDPVSHTRYFVIQGSDSLDHWKVNLTFDPVVFEDPSLGVKVWSKPDQDVLSMKALGMRLWSFAICAAILVGASVPFHIKHGFICCGLIPVGGFEQRVLLKIISRLAGNTFSRHLCTFFAQVHRGVYDAAKRLYERFRPMLEEHLASSPFARVAFVGHSLGGSLGSLLMLMFLHRGVLPHSAVSPTYTFGAPAIFCEASGPGGTCALRTVTPDPIASSQKVQVSSEVRLYLLSLRFTPLCVWHSHTATQMAEVHNLALSEHTLPLS